MDDIIQESRLGGKPKRILPNRRNKGMIQNQQLSVFSPSDDVEEELLNKEHNGRMKKTMKDLELLDTSDELEFIDEQDDTAAEGNEENETSPRLGTYWIPTAQKFTYKPNEDGHIIVKCNKVMERSSSKNSALSNDDTSSTEEKELITISRKRKSQPDTSKVTSLELDVEEDVLVSSPKPKRKRTDVKMFIHESVEEYTRKRPAKKAQEKKTENSTNEKALRTRSKEVTTYYESDENEDDEIREPVKPKRKKKFEKIVWPKDPLPDAENLPEFPNTGKCEWSFEPSRRKLLAKFLTDDIDDEDRNFLLHMMERTDIALVSEGLYKEKHQKCWNLGYIKHRAGNQISHRIRRFKLVKRTAAQLYKSRFDVDPKTDDIDNETELFVTPMELNRDTSMRISDYIDYIQEWEKLSQNGFEQSKDKVFKTSSIDEYDLAQDRLYLIDFDFKKMLPESYESFKNKFMLPEVLPGGEYCLMRSVTPEAQPFMGPNLYLTPPGSYTHFHQDGHGTVDSGHLCLRGYNEVVMLRRMDEGRKQHALHLLTGDDRRRAPINFDGLYGLPHDDGKKPEWPDNDAIRACEKMNYYPCVFILEPGQLLHIGKGRLHAFRKMTCDTLEPSDCHHTLRKEMIQKRSILHDPLCFSIAWDWMFMGHTQDGTMNEVQVVLDCEKLAFQNAVRSLATPDLCLIEMAKEELARLESFSEEDRYVSRSFQNLMGIAPFVLSSLRTQIKIIQNIRGNRHLGVLVYDIPDAQKKDSSVDAYGNDYFCKICQRELSNIYFHCEGCENLLAKDFNVCPDCYDDRSKIDISFQMHPHRPTNQTKGRRSDYNHLGGERRDFKRTCACKNGPPCLTCGFQVCCSCKCHKKYSMRLRLNSFQDLRNLLKGVEKYYTGNDLMDDQSLSELKHDSISFFSESEDEVVEASEKNSNVWCQQTMPNDNGNEILEFSHLSGIHTPNKSRRSVVSDVRYASSSPDSSHVTVSASSPVSTAGSTSSVMHAMSPNFCYI